MNEKDDASTVWSRYRNAKQHAFAEQEEKSKEERLTLEELELSIAQTAASSGIPETGMPPRAVVHPSKHKQLSRWFYRILVALFTALAAGLVWWGRGYYG